jgi:hypothetical protein
MHVASAQRRVVFPHFGHKKYGFRIKVKGNFLGIGSKSILVKISLRFQL